MKKSTQLSGWETLLNTNRNVKVGGERFDALIPKAKGTRREIDEDMNPFHTVPQMYRIVKQTAHQTAALSKEAIISVYPSSQSAVEGLTKNIWQFIFDYILYKEETDEELRQPSHSWHIQRKKGCDCDDMAIFAGSLLHNLKIPFLFRITKYTDNLTGLVGNWQHVYVIVPTAKPQANGKSYIVIDPVLNQYNYEIPYAQKHDFIMPTYELGGLGGNPNDAHTDMVELLQVILDKTKRDTLFAQSLGYNPLDLVKMCEKALSANDDTLFAQIIETLAQKEQALNIQNGLSGLGVLDIEGDYDEDWSGDLGTLKSKIKNAVAQVKGKIAPKANQRTTTASKAPVKAPIKAPIIAKLDTKKQNKNLFQTIHKVIKEKTTQIKQKIEQKAGKPLKQVLLHAATKLPNAAGRAGLHLFFKLNIAGLAECLRWGYLTQAQAQSEGIATDKWKKAQTGVDKLKKFHYQMGGSDAVLETVIKTHLGKRGMKGFSDEYEYNQVLGVAGIDDAALLMAALPTIAGALKLIHDTGLISLKKVSPQATAPKAHTNVRGMGTGDESGGAAEIQTIEPQIPSLEVNSSIPLTLPSQNLIEAESDQEKKKLLGNIWEMIKGFFARKKVTDFSSGEEMDMNYQSEVSEEKFKSDAATSTNTGVSEDTNEGTTGEGDNTLRNIGIGLTAAILIAKVVLPMMSTDNKTSPPKAAIAQSDLGKISNTDQQAFFKEAKTRKGFSLQ